MMCLHFASLFNWALMTVGLCLLCCVNSQKDIKATTASGAVAPSSTLVECGETQKMVDECFKDLPPHLMEFLQTTKIVVNKEEIDAKCTVFKRGMNCFDSYAERCLNNEKKYLFNNNVAGARRFLGKFCDDPQFQADYLKHKECFTHIQEDWMKCTKNFQHILSEELHSIGKETTSSRNITMKFMQFCCTRHAYENCIYNSARYKCYKNSANFARDTAQMLSEEKHFSNCRKYEQILCTASTSSSASAAGRPNFRHMKNGPLVGLLLWLLIQLATTLQAVMVE